MDFDTRGQEGLVERRMQLGLGQPRKRNARYEDKQNKGLFGIEQALDKYLLNEWILDEGRVIKTELLPSTGPENSILL